MKILLSWLREFVEVRLPAEELAHLLSMSGTEVAAVAEIGAHWSGVRIGQVRALRPHPAAERLLVAEVELGDRPANLVTAATNLAAGDKVPVVLAGGSIQPGVTVEAVDFKGVRSEGMLCSGIELGISPDGQGIYVLEGEAPVGQDLKAYLGDTLLDLDVTPNRPDCLSVAGVAREVAALTGTKMRIPPTTIAQSGFRSAEAISVEIRDPDLCSRYCAIALRGVRVKPSPPQVQRRLHLCGVRPIGNIVDVTNYIMLERGQPLHAFDARKLKGGIVVRRAAQGEQITTLDGEVRTLSGEVLVIADQERAVAIAGVMGDLYSEVDDTTETVILESANFSRSSIRRTSRELRLATEASKRFDKGLDPELTMPSALRAAVMMAELSGASVGRGVVDAFPRPIAPAVLSISEPEAEGLLGLAFSRDEMERILRSLEFQTSAIERDRLQVIVPTFRRDVEGRADLAEELARIKGYDLIPTTLPTGAIPEALPEPYRIWERVARDTLTAAGFHEVITYSLVDAEATRRVTAEMGDGAVRVPHEMLRLENPMTPEQAYLRTTLLPSILRTVASNLRHERRVCVFELARVYLPPLEPLPTERRTLTMALTGPREPEGWDSQREPADFFDLKGAVEALLRALGIEQAEFRPARHASMHPGRTAVVVVGDRVVGHLGEVHPKVADRYDLQPSKPFAAELDFETLISMASPERVYNPLPRFPAVSHDIAVVVEERVAQVDVERTIRDAGAPLLDGVELFDLYHGASIPPGKKSLAYSLSYRAPDRTLADEEVMETESRVVDALTNRFGAYLRGR